MPDLNRCRMCGRVISGEAIACPHCGAKYPQVPIPNQTPDGEAHAPFPGAEDPAQEAYTPSQEAYTPSQEAYTPSQETYAPYQGMETRLTETEAAQAEASAPITHPMTIEELRLYCAQHGMPLEKMRFFIGEDCPEPRAFGIYRDGDRFVVYKNKDNGNRAVRYHGPDEAYAVNELFTKLLDECHKRGIYPDGQPAARDPLTRGGTPVRQQYAASPRGARSRGGSGGKSKTWLAILLIIALLFAYRWYTHRNDGYYRLGDTTYYRSGDDWFYYAAADWLESDYGPDYYYGSDYDDYYIGSDYDPDWDVSDVTYSEAWDESDSGGFFSWFGSDDDDDHDYGSDYGGWDSSDTDWDSDW